MSNFVFGFRIAIYNILSKTYARYLGIAFLMMVDLMQIYKKNRCALTCAKQ